MSLASLDFEKIASDTDGIIDGIPVREIIHDFFVNSPKDQEGNSLYGTPDNISRNGCLNLAKMSNRVGGEGNGHLLWNAWRDSSFPKLENGFWINKSDFFELNLSEHQIDFSHFHFGDYADFRKIKGTISSQFQNATWGNGANFSGSHLEGMVNFSDTHWGSHAYFRNSIWGNCATFSRSSWEGHVNFNGSIFGDYANFHKTKWGSFCDFEGTVWGESLSFDSSQWGEKVSFRGASFGRWAHLQNTLWNGTVEFDGLDWDSLNSICGEKARGELNKKIAQSRGASPYAFLSIDFSGAQFNGQVSFSNRKFGGQTKFTPAEFKSSLIPVRFGVSPKFHGCELHQDTSFEGAQFPPDIRKAEGSETAARAYRTLKLAFSKQQAIREEHHFFRLEMQEEAVSYRLQSWQALKNLKPHIALRDMAIWFLYKLYAWFSNYGFSVIRPLLLLAVLWLVFARVYGDYSELEICWKNDSAWALQSDWLAYSAQQALPLPGFEKLVNIDSIKNVSIGWLAAHKTLSLAALFLLGLALRNLFKLK